MTESPVMPVRQCTSVGSAQAVVMNVVSRTVIRKLEERIAEANAETERLRKQRDMLLDGMEQALQLLQRLVRGEK